MGFRSFISTFIAGLFGRRGEAAPDHRTPVPNEPEDVTEVHRRNILTVMMPTTDAEDGQFFAFDAIVNMLYVSGSETWRLPGHELLSMIEQMVEEGLVQRIDGGNKRLAIWLVKFTISDNGLNYIGLPGR